MARFVANLDDGCAGAIVLENWLSAQNIAEPDRVLLVKVGDGNGVVSLDVADSAVAAQSQVGVESYKPSWSTLIPMHR